jgi:hypothetical protein
MKKFSRKKVKKEISRDARRITKALKKIARQKE